MAVYGAISRMRTDDLKGTLGTLGRTCNADLLLRRLHVQDDNDLELAHLNAVAQACAVPDAWLAALHQRRAAAAGKLAGRTFTGQDQVVRTVEITPEWRVVVGHGEDSASETSLTLSPTYGVPVLPGSALKGVAASQARADALPHLGRWFGQPRPGDEPPGHRGSVVFFDALPVSSPKVVVDVLTPHVKPYYDQASKRAAGTGEKVEVPPAEYHNPVPVRFLAVAKSHFRALLLGPVEDVEAAGELLCKGLTELGIGGKTAAGYGYCEATIMEVNQ